MKMTQSEDYLEKKEMLQTFSTQRSDLAEHTFASIRTISKNDVCSPHRRYRSDIASHRRI